MEYVLIYCCFAVQGSIHIAESWRMLHSIAAQVEYVNQLNLSLQDLVQYSLDQYETAASNTNRTTVQETTKVWFALTKLFRLSNRDFLNSWFCAVCKPYAVVGYFWAIQNDAKKCKIRSLKPWHMGTHLRVFSKRSNEYQHDRVCQADIGHS